MLPKVKSISGIADVQGCGVPSPLPQQTIYVRRLRYCDHTGQIVRSPMFLRLLHDYK
ncbi:hypothetical protein ACQVTU_32365 [Bacillus cereus]|uniref:hypothetical protein n=1 Tax=Bacillus cereus TaxID=1396 RepID=UPI003D64F84A